MSLPDDLPFHRPLTPHNYGAPEPRGCRRHTWYREAMREPDGSTSYSRSATCLRCGQVQDAAASRRGRTSLRAGKDAERAVAAAYGGKRTGQYGGADDVLVGDLFVIQSKAGGWFSERYWTELAKLPRTGGRVPTLVVSDRPGKGGGRTRRLVIRTMEDDVALHGTLREGANE